MTKNFAVPQGGNWRREAYGNLHFPANPDSAEQGVMKANIQADLLEVLSMQAGCMYLSDLHDLSDWQRERLRHTLRHLPPDAAPLKEWNDALLYLSKGPPEQTAEAARARLIQFLSHAESGT